MTGTNHLNQQVVQLVNYRGGFAWRNNTGAIKRNGGMIRFGYVGSGDVIGMYHGHFISIETKTGDDKPSKAQLEFVDNVKRAGGFACFVGDIDQATSFLDQIDAIMAKRDSDQIIPF